MTLRVKIQIANVLCVVFFAASVVTVFIYTHLSGPFLTLAVICGMMAAKWKKEITPEEITSLKRTPAASSSIFRRIMVGVAWLFFALLTASLFLLGGSRLYQWYLFRHQAIEVAGSVVSKEMTQNRQNNYYITYDYFDKSGESFRIQTSVDGRTWDSLSEGGSIPVKYLPGKPWDSRVDIEFEDQDEGTGAVGTLCIGFAFLVFGGWGFYDYLKKSRVSAAAA